MSYSELGKAITKVVRWLNDNHISYALVGGLAVSFRTIERATKDVDLAIASKDSFEADNIIRAFQSINFHPTVLLESKTRKTVSTVRLLSEEFPGVYLDLLFATSGVEQEVVDSGEMIEILPGLDVRVASHSSLIAMKVLSGTNKDRKQDLIDLDNLIKDAQVAELEEAARLIKLIEVRGFNHGEDLTKIFNSLLKEAR